MFKFFCDDCKKPLENQPFIFIPQIELRTITNVGRGTNVHFCDEKCLSSYVVKNTNKPVIHGAQ